MNDKLEFFQFIFGKGKVDYYRTEIDNAYRQKGKYKNDHGLFHSGLVLYINSGGKTGEFYLKAAVR